MKTEPITIEAIRITDIPGLDPITVMLQDHEPGAGTLTIACFGESWSKYGGGMGGKTLREFILFCDDDYLANKLSTGAKKKIAYLRRIVRAVQEALRQPVARECRTRTLLRSALAALDRGDHDAYFQIMLEYLKVAEEHITAELAKP